MINIFFSSYSWIRDRNEDGLRHHLFELYTTVFKEWPYETYPKEAGSTNVTDALKHLSKIRPHTLNIIAPGYPVLSACLAICVNIKARFIVHTWKVPGISDERLSARMYDAALDRVMRHADLIVVASRRQHQEVEKRYPDKTVIFVPVTVDHRFWAPQKSEEKCLSLHGLHLDNYILTVGGNDRDEEFGIILSEQLNKLYVRATNDPETAQVATEKIDQYGAGERAKVLFNVTDRELRYLYQRAYCVCLPVITRTNPAGLSVLVEAMACGALIIAPNDLAEGYLVDGQNGIVYSDSDSSDMAARIKKVKAHDDSSLRQKARQFAVQSLDSSRVADEVANYVGKLGILKNCTSP